MRTAQQERARYTGMRPSEFGDAVGVSAETVYQLIADGWFCWMRDEHGRSVPECQDTRRMGAKLPQYRIHRSAVTRWFAERAVVKGAA
jgi:hypothetical protein